MAHASQTQRMLAVPAVSATAARRFYSASPADWHRCSQCGDDIAPKARHTRGSQAGEYVCGARCARERHAQLTWEGK